MQEAAARPRCAGRGLWGRNRGGLWGWGLTVEHTAAKRPQARTAAASISPSTVLRALRIPPPNLVLLGNASAPLGCSPSTRATLCCQSSLPPLPLSACPSFSSCPQHPFTQSTHCSCPRAASPPRRPHQTRSSGISLAPQVAPSRRRAARSEGRRYWHPRLEESSPLAPQ